MPLLPTAYCLLPIDRDLFHCWDQFSGEQVKGCRVAGERDHDFVESQLSQRSEGIEGRRLQDDRFEPLEPERA